MPISREKRPRIPRTEDWQTIQQRSLWPEQVTYEMIRPVVLFSETPAERAKETGEARRSLYRKVEQFEDQGMVGLFKPTPQQREDTHRNLPTPMRQAIVDLQAEFPFLHLREIATVCYIQFGRRPSHHTIQAVLASSPPPTTTRRRYPPGRRSRTLLNAAWLSFASMRKGCILPALPAICKPVIRPSMLPSRGGWKRA